MKISVSVALNTKGPSAKSKEKLKLARAALQQFATWDESFQVALRTAIREL